MSIDLKLTAIDHISQEPLTAGNNVSMFSTSLLKALEYHDEEREDDQKTAPGNSVIGEEFW